MAQRKLLHEAGTLTKPVAGASTYPIRIISEGKGSSGVYSRELLAEYKDAFEGALSFMNHPLDPAKPHLRDVTGIAGRLVGSVEAKEVDGEFGLYSEYKPDPRWAGFVEEYADSLGLSIYISGDGREEGGEYIVESFDGSDPYRSVDVVIAAGRGGRFERARESLRAIESSLGSPTGEKPEATSAQETQQKENHMEKEILEALTAIKEALVPVVSFVTESKAAATATAQAEAQAEVDDKAVAEALDAYEKDVAAIDAADLLPSQVESLRSAAKRGEDIAPLIESAKKIVDEATQALSEGTVVSGAGRVTESATTEASAALPKGW